MTKILRLSAASYCSRLHGLPATGDLCILTAEKPLVAIVAHVFDDALVNLAVFDSNGTSHSRTSVPLVQEGEAKPEQGYF